MMTVKLITFDVTGTLLFFRTPILEKYVETGLKFGIRADYNIIEENFKHSWKTLNEEHPNFGKTTGLHWRKWWECFVERTFTGYIKEEERNKISEMSEYMIAFHTTKDAFTKRPGTDDLLQYLTTKNIQLGVISNYDPRLSQILELMELKKYFKFILTSYELGCSKPQARIFEEALRLGCCSSGKEAVHVGDDLRLDYLGAKEAGLNAVFINTNEKHLENCKVNKSEVFKDFFALKEFFMQELNKHD